MRVRRDRRHVGVTTDAVVTAPVAPNPCVACAACSRPRTGSGAPAAAAYCPPPECPRAAREREPPSGWRARESAPIALASFVMSETTVVSRSSEADRTRRGTGGAGSDSPGTTIPPIAAGPVDGLSAVLPAASPAAEMPGFGLDTAGPPRFRTTGGWPSCEPPPAVALPRAHHLHVARPPVRVYENAARKAQRIKGRPKKRNRRSGFTPLSLGRREQGDGVTKYATRAATRRHRHRRSVRTHRCPGRRRRRSGRNEEAHAGTHDTIWYRGAAAKTGIHLRRHQICRIAPEYPPSSTPSDRPANLPGSQALTEIPEETRSDAFSWLDDRCPRQPAPRASARCRCRPPIGEPTSDGARGPLPSAPAPTAKAGSR